MTRIERLKEIRTQKAFSQEALAHLAGVSLRTIQRIENGDSIPRGDTLKRIAQVLEVEITELTKLEQSEQIAFLKKLNRSAMTFVIAPFLGVIVPLIFWRFYRDIFKSLKKFARQLIIFQSVWLILFATSLLYYSDIKFNTSFDKTGVRPSYFANIIDLLIIALGFYLVNLFVLIKNDQSLAKNKLPKYFPNFSES